MTASRETIMNALLAQLVTATVNGAPAFNTSGRRLKLWSDVPGGDQPAIFLVEKNEIHTQQPPQGLTSKVQITANAIIYVATTDPTIPPFSLANPVLDALTVALQPDDLYRNVFTLGGLVYRCWIEGTIMMTPGDLDGQAMMIVPIILLLP